MAEELTLSIDPVTGEYTRLTRFLPGADTAPFGGKTHDYPEEVWYCPKKDFRWLREYSGHLVGQQGSGGAILQTAMEPLFVIPALKG